MVWWIDTHHTNKNGIMSLEGLIGRFKSLDSDKIVDFVIEVMDSNLLFLVELQKFQLLAGQNSIGEYLSPTYIEDSYFKSKDSAKRYSDFKESLSQETNTEIYKKKPKDVPNLIITGSLIYNTIYAKTGSDYIEISARSSIIGKLEAKYKNLFGINKTGWDYFSDKYLIPQLNDKIINYLTT